MIRETDRDRIEQAKAMQEYMLLRCATGLRAEETRPLAETDYFVWQEAQNVMVEAVEIKRRYHKCGTYPTVTMEPSKLEFGLRLARGLRIESTYLVRWDDRIGWANMRWITPLTEYGGRFDRGEAGDEGEKLFVPLEQFTIITP